MKTLGTVVASFIIATAQHLHANGGGYIRGGIETTGDVGGFEPSSTENIRILDEKLTVKLGPKQADVEVRYVMRNETAKKVKVKFGFPVEESFDQNLMGGDEKTPDRKTLAYCKNYQISAGGKQIKSTWQGELKDTSDSRFKGIAGWLISEQTFGPNEERPVMISFQSEYPVEEWNVSDNETRSPAIFRYRLSSASCWAGTIGKGRIVIQPDGISAEDLKVLKPVNRFKKEDDNWVWSFENLEPSLADDIEIEARPQVKIYGHQSEEENASDLPEHRYVDYMERSGRWSMIHSNYQVKASSTLKPEDKIDYSAENVRGRYSATAWSEGSPGTGKNEWLEIKPEVTKPLLGILLKGGYQKEGLFGANARPKRIQIELNGEHSFEAKIPDVQEEIEISVRGYKKRVSKIRITFLENYPGSKFEDLCVTSIGLNVLLDKKPDVGHAR